MKKGFLGSLFLFLSFSGFAQVLNSTTVEVVGSPSWYRAISLEDKGLILILKEDQTRFKVVRYDMHLAKLWEQDLFLDTEKPPAAIRQYQGRLALVFSETSGMYYQLIDFDLKGGEYFRRGFEIRDFFQDSDLVMFKDKVVLVGTNEKGAAYFVYDFKSDLGRIIETGLTGKITINHVSLDSDSLLNILATEKMVGYTNEKKKKGEYVRSSQIVYTQLDTSGIVKSKKTIVQNSGRFPVSATIQPEKEIVSGIYQDTKGDKGVYFSFLDKPQNTPTFFVSFRELVGNQLSEKDKKKFYGNADFYVLSPKTNSQEIFIGGIFYTRKYQYFNSNQGFNLTSGRNSSASQPVMAGLEFSSAFVFNLDAQGTKTLQNQIPVNQTSAQFISPLTINNAGSVAYVSKGKLLIRNFEVGTKPVVYQLTEDTDGVASYVPGYTQVMHWHDNVFLAIGSQSKVEAQQLEQDKISKKKKKKSRPFTQTRKTYFLTSVSAGQAR
jgi:hypothetical protein